MKRYLIVILFISGCKSSPDFEYRERALCLNPVVTQEERCSNNSMGRAVVGGLLFGKTGAIVGGVSGSSRCKMVEVKKCDEKHIIEACWSRRHLEWVKAEYCIDAMKESSRDK